MTSFWVSFKSDLVGSSVHQLISVTGRTSWIADVMFSTTVRTDEFLKDELSDQGQA